MDEKSEKIKNSKINRVLGIFILFFGIIIIISMVFTETFIGQMTNLIAGAILCLIAVSRMMANC